MKANLVNNAEQYDARGPSKFDGSQEDVFPHKKLGHIPNSINILGGIDRSGNPELSLRMRRFAARFQAAGIDLQRAHRHNLWLGHHFLRRSARSLSARQKRRRRL